KVRRGQARRRRGRLRRVSHDVAGGSADPPAGASPTGRLPAAAASPFPARRHAAGRPIRGNDMQITAAQVKELRERSGAGMMECKKALAENTGDIDAAMEFLRKTGLAKADKKAGRVAAEGRIVLAQAGDKAVLVEINSETDFVAKDENFLAFSEKVAQVA